MADPNRASKSQVEAAQICVKRVVNARRRRLGFSQPVTSRQWSAPAVEKTLQRSYLLLISNCCQAEWEELARNHYTEDDELDSALLATEYAINGLMTFSDEVPSRQPVVSVVNEQSVSEPLAPPTEQDMFCAAASEYIHRLLEADDWVQEYQANFSKLLTEQKMVDFLLSPLSQVLSFTDFRQLNLCPVTTYGHLTLIEEQEVPRTFSTMAQQEFARYRHESATEIRYQFAVELEGQDGSTTNMTVERRGRLETRRYSSWAMEAGPDALAGAGGFRDGDFCCFHKGGLGDRDDYPTFPIFSFTGYPGSICTETFDLITTMIENDFYSDQSAALRFLLMGIRSSLYGLSVVGSDSLYVPEWMSIFSTKTILNVPNWVLPEDLANYWRQVRSPKARDRRLPSAASLQLFRFVLKNTLPSSEPQWASLARRWHEETNERMTRDKLYKMYYSVVSALFPCHPDKQSTQAMQERTRKDQRETLPADPTV